MTRAEIDTLWQQAMEQAIKDGEMFTRYHFAKLVADAEREACAQICDSYAKTDHANYADSCAEEIRARGRS